MENNLKIYPISYSFIGYMPDGSRQEFVSDVEYKEAVEEYNDEFAQILKLKKEVENGKML